MCQSCCRVAAEHHERIHHRRCRRSHRHANAHPRWMCSGRSCRNGWSARARGPSSGTVPPRLAVARNAFTVAASCCARALQHCGTATLCEASARSQRHTAARRQCALGTQQQQHAAMTTCTRHMFDTRDVVTRLFVACCAHRAATTATTRCWRFSARSASATHSRTHRRETSQTSVTRARQVVACMHTRQRQRKAHRRRGEQSRGQTVSAFLCFQATRPHALSARDARDVYIEHWRRNADSAAMNYSSTIAAM